MRTSESPKPAVRLIVLSGLPGTGKSTIAQELAGALPAIWLRVDTIEAAILKAGLPRSFETGLAAYLAAADIARDHLRHGTSVIVDAVNGVEPARRMWRELAAECRIDRVVVEVTVGDRAEHRRRVETRASATPPLPAPTWAEVEDREYLPWSEPVLAVDGQRPAAENVARILRYAAERSARGA